MKNENDDCENDEGAVDEKIEISEFKKLFNALVQYTIAVIN